MLARLRKYGRDEDGSIIVFTVVMFLTMVVACGMAVDFMRHETARADLQNALDRGVLASAALSQTYVEELIASDNSLPDTKAERERQYAILIKSYMKSRSFPSEPVVTVGLKESVTGREITATAEYTLNTFFLKIPGLTTMRVPARAQAKQVAQDVEISLVLDISGSMYNPNNKVTYINDQDQIYEEFRIEVLKTEAARFATYMLGLDPSEDKSKTTISVVPYSHQVSLPAEMASQYAAFSEDNRSHSQSWCIDFDDVDYASTYVDTTVAYKQTDHFWWDINRSSANVYGCSNSTNSILPFSNDPLAVEAKINGMTEEHLTAIYQGMKWGVTLLDPATQPVIAALAVEGGIVPTLFSSRPKAWGAEDSLKVVVLISDGSNTYQPRVEDALYDSMAIDAEYSEGSYWEFWDTFGNGNMPKTAQDICDSSATSTEKPAWRAFNNPCNNTYGEHITYDGIVTRDASNNAIRIGDARLYDICDAAYNSGIIVYTIGFNVGAFAQRALDECATSDNRSFIADGTDLRDKFDIISADIQNLRLTN